MHLTLCSVNCDTADSLTRLSRALSLSMQPAGGSEQSHGRSLMTTAQRGFRFTADSARLDFFDSLNINTPSMQQPFTERLVWSSGHFQHK